LSIAKVVHESLRKLCNDRLELFASVGLLYIVVLVKCDHDEADHHSNQSAEISQVAQALWSDVDEVVAS
jgi:hypothetical protein